MTKALHVPDYRAHILKAIERIDRYTADMREVPEQRTRAGRCNP
jgi:hypothetical protein